MRAELHGNSAPIEKPELFFYVVYLELRLVLKVRKSQKIFSLSSNIPKKPTIFQVSVLASKKWANENTHFMIVIVLFNKIKCFYYFDSTTFLGFLEYLKTRKNSSEIFWPLCRTFRIEISWSRDARGWFMLPILWSMVRLF